MSHDWLQALDLALRSGELSWSSMVQWYSAQSNAHQHRSPSATPELDLDVDRARRCGFPEVIYGPGKRPEVVLEAARRLHEAGQSVLATRLDSTQFEALERAFPEGVSHRTAKTWRLLGRAAQSVRCQVAVVTAGTGDLPVAEEACETLAWMNVPVRRIFDAGVAGPHRLPQHLPTLRDCVAVVVVAGMEGALPSVVGGHVSVPVIGVPTSVGYGANLGGFAALLSMLNSCAANVTVVNVDAGFKGGYIAGLMAHAIAVSEVPHSTSINEESQP